MFAPLVSVGILTALSGFSTTTSGPDDITGSVHNLTLSEPARAEEVVLIRLDGEMPEEARVKTDEYGGFAFQVQHPDKAYLVRVIHQGVEYDRRASGGRVLAIGVCDAATKVPGVSGSIEIIRAGVRGKLLQVSDMYEIENNSSPPITQAGKRTFEVYLPRDAKIDSVLAAGPAEIAAMISAEPVPGEPGHYTVAFPLVPGATRFAFNYDVSYSGRAIFQTRRKYAVRQLAVMISPNMSFSSRSASFQLLPTGKGNFRVHAANDVGAGRGPVFELSGTGSLPALDSSEKLTEQARAGISPNAIVAAPVQWVSPALPRKDPRWSSAPPSQAIALYALSSILLLVCVLLVWRNRTARCCSSSASNDSEKK